MLKNRGFSDFVLQHSKRTHGFLRRVRPPGSERPIFRGVILDRPLNRGVILDRFLNRDVILDRFLKRGVNLDRNHNYFLSVGTCCHIPPLGPLRPRYLSGRSHGNQLS